VEAVGPVVTMLPPSCTVIAVITIEGQEGEIPVRVEGGSVAEARLQVAEAMMWIAYVVYKDRQRWLDVLTLVLALVGLVGWFIFSVLLGK
jgi:hypothetical protein